MNAAKLALEARAFPFLTYDPDAGKDIAACAAPGSTHVADGGKESFCFIENFGDIPFTKSAVGPETVAVVSAHWIRPM